jgi:predicted XRE-type DNA-binding protein
LRELEECLVALVPIDGETLPGEAENLRVRSDLLIRLGEVIKTRRLTQAAAAKLLGVSQPRVSDLMRGKIDRFSVDSLVEMLGRIGMRVDFTTTRRRARVA